MGAAFKNMGSFVLRWHTIATTASMNVTPRWLSATLTRSNTTGPGQKVHNLAVTVSSSCWFADPSWLRCGFGIWRDLAFERDYLLPCPSKDLEGVRRCIAIYQDAAIFSQSLFNTLRLPICSRTDEAASYSCHWTSEDENLLAPGLGRFWSEHSERNGVTSLAAAIGVSSDDRKVGTLVCRDIGRICQNQPKDCGARAGQSCCGCQGAITWARILQTKQS